MTFKIHSIAAALSLCVMGASARAGTGSFPLPTGRTGISETQDLISKAVKDATAGREEDPLKYIVKDMGSVAVDLGKYQTDHPVQQKEERVVADLELVIKKLEEQMKKGGSGGGGLNPSRPMADSVIAGGPGGIRDLHDPKAGEKTWGNLPPKQREQILQSKTDGFPPGYEALLQSYYRRLAQEQIGADTSGGATGAAPAAAPTTNPSR
ncbi:MAG TPA: hypothetical protein VF669_22570 [Tepidisphaeraceae bacterium]